MNQLMPPSLIDRQETEFATLPTVQPVLHGEMDLASMINYLQQKRPILLGRELTALPLDRVNWSSMRLSCLGLALLRPPQSILHLCNIFTSISNLYELK
jgi:hypothetical protein